AKAAQLLHKFLVRREIQPGLGALCPHSRERWSGRYRSRAARRLGRSMRKALALILLVVAANAAMWYALNRPATDIPDWNHRISGAAWSPYPIDGGPNLPLASDAELRADMERMARHIRSIRTYSTLNGIDRLPALAEGLPLTFTLGASVYRNDIP